MKRIVCLLLMLCMGAYALCGCNADRAESEVTGNVDIDLAALNTNLVFAQISAMYVEPWNYTNKTVRVRGTLDFYVSEGGTEHSMVMVADAAACCAQGIESVWKSGGRYTEAYPNMGDEVTVIGRFEQYQEEGYSGIHLVDADVEWNR